MSLATLKKKTQAKYNNSSVGASQFSINGTHRNQGYIGQTSLSRSLPRTLAKGNTPKGHGGCCGKYVVKPPILSAVTSTEDNSVVKSSVLSYTGMAATKYRWIRRSEPVITVKPDNNQNANTQQQYIEYLKRLTIQEINSCDNTKVFHPCSSNKSTCNFTKPETDYVPMSQGQYLLELNNKCTNNNYMNPSANQRTPFGAKYASSINTEDTTERLNQTTQRIGGLIFY
jgi:hypothetical protein